MILIRTGPDLQHGLKTIIFLFRRDPASQRPLPLPPPQNPGFTSAFIRPKGLAGQP